MATDAAPGPQDVQREPSAQWQRELANMIRSADELVSYLQLPASLIDEALSGQSQFPVRVTRHYADKIEKGNLQDPLLLQVLPLLAEGDKHANYSIDPLAESHFQANQGILHKYHGRALLITTGACAIHCRYCFRRHFPYQDHRQSLSDWENTLQTITRDSSIKEVILSGGDPLMLTDRHLSGLVKLIEAIPHVQTLRIHSRLPVVLPSRVTPELQEILSETRLKTVVVIHSNHANEIDTNTGRALKQLSHSTDALLNQAVLLRGINDSGEQLVQLSEALFRNGVLPYYLHLLDKVAGAAHFDSNPADVERIMQALRSSLPGYLVPKLVREIPGESSKSPVWA
ncbi:EF-P beta-lysylation protein EpmB [Hahella sp. CCB-MM4]|nr:EF-P beta-lysylation protein EpmB [Hahella sp. CCB-MM4]